MDGKSDKWSGMEGKREREMAVSGGGGGGGVEEEFAVGCVVEQIETDTHPQQESLTPSRKHTHTHTQACKMQTHTQTNRHARTHQEHMHTHKMVSWACIHRDTHDVWAGCGHSRCCP